jgi:hypothetical protein
MVHVVPLVTLHSEKVDTYAILTHLNCIVDMGPVMLVTADGSIDCSDRPSDQVTASVDI